MTHTSPLELTATSSAQQVVDAFPQFYGNPTIRTLGTRRAWAISDVDKRPVAVPSITEPGGLRGASVHHPEDDLVTLSELTYAVPNANNCALHLDIIRDNVVMLDIEPTCPTTVANRLLSVAKLAFYTETSMSGRGYHLLMPIPESFYNHDALCVSMPSALKHPTDGYEVLLTHWVTCTRRPIPPNRMHTVTDIPTDIDAAATRWSDIFDELVTAAAPKVKHTYTALGGATELYELSHDDEESPGVTDDIHIVNDTVAEFAETYTKTPDDFSHDLSRWEYSQIATLTRIAHMRLTAHNPHMSIDDQAYATRLARIVYTATKQVVSYRSKHDGYRNGMPFLLYQTVSLISRTDLHTLPRTTIPAVIQRPTDNAGSHHHSSIASSWSI